MCVYTYVNIPSTCKYIHTLTYTEVRLRFLYCFLLLSDKKLLLATRGTTTSSKGQKRGNKPLRRGNEGGREKSKNGRNKEGERNWEGSKEGQKVKERKDKERKEGGSNRRCERKAEHCTFTLGYSKTHGHYCAAATASTLLVSISPPDVGAAAGICSKKSISEVQH